MSSGKKLKLTLASLEAQRQVTNNCAVARFAASIEDDESREVLYEALGLSPKELSAPALRAWLIGEGADPDEVPSSTRIADHRRGKGACKCQRA